MAAAPPTPPTCWPARSQPHGGVVLYRAFVYNNHLDYNDLKADRARAAYDIFHPLDGKFAPNVIVQIKEGPIDFQAREPVSPLFAGLHKTSAGHGAADHAGVSRPAAPPGLSRAACGSRCSTSTCARRTASTPVKSIIEGKSLRPAARRHGGRLRRGARSWLGSPHGAWRISTHSAGWRGIRISAPEQIADEWTRQTISNDPQVVATVDKMLMQSWPAYVHYTGPLGTQTLTDITGSHYGPNIEASEGNGWGQWHRDDHEGIGMDRTVATGTGFAGQYPPAVAKMYESAATTPDDLLLFFHHVPYTYKLHSGKTVIQYFYDSHYQGAARGGAARRRMGDAERQDRSAALRRCARAARVPGRPRHRLARRDRAVFSQAERHSRCAWAAPDIIPAAWKPKTRGSTGYTDHRREAVGGRIGRKGCCVRAEELQRSAVARPSGPMRAAAGRFDIAVQYFDLQGGVAQFALDVNGNSGLAPGRRTRRCRRAGPTATTQRASRRRRRAAKARRHDSRGRHAGRERPGGAGLH